METIQWVQDTAFATWIRESAWAIFAFLIVHTIAMGFVVGTGVAVDARVLGLVIAALIVTWQLRRRVFQPGLPEAPGWARAAALASLVMWLSALTAGKFLEYTHKMLLVY